jgi:hypothetical protein
MSQVEYDFSKRNRMNLLDALCIQQCGWRTEHEYELYSKALELIGNHVASIRLEAQIKECQERLNILKEKP